jgi:hypothetical protein
MTATGDRQRDEAQRIAGSIRRPAPWIGAHNDEFHDGLFGRGEVCRLHEEGVVQEEFLRVAP